MKMLALSDMHGYLPPLPTEGVDCVLLAGDVCPAANHKPRYQLFWLEHDFHTWCRRVHIPIYLTLGNHDFVSKFQAPPNLHYGIEDIVDDILLFSWTPPFYDWAWMATEEILARKLAHLLNRQPLPRLWLTHGPPLGVCDEVQGKHVGSAALRDAILAHEPELVICGHLHEGAPRGRLGSTEVYNVSVLNECYKRYREPVLIDWPVCFKKYTL